MSNYLQRAVLTVVQNKQETKYKTFSLILANLDRSEQLFSLYVHPNIILFFVF